MATANEGSQKSKPLPTLTCQWCGVSFTPRQKSQSFDSPACRTAFNNRRKAAVRNERLSAARNRCQMCGIGKTMLYQTKVSDGEVYVLCGQCRVPYQKEQVTIDHAVLYNAENPECCAEWERLLRAEGLQVCGVLADGEFPFRGYYHRSMFLADWRGVSDDDFHRAGLCGDGGIGQLIDYLSGEGTPHPFDTDESVRTVYASTGGG